MADLDYIKRVEEEVASKVEAAKLESLRRVEEARLGRSGVLSRSRVQAEEKAVALVDSAVKGAADAVGEMLCLSELNIKRIQSVPLERFDAAVEAVLKELGVKIA